MVKELFIFLVLISLSVRSHSQNLKVSLVVEISDEYIYLNRNGLPEKTVIPFLIIKYDNNTGRDIYLKKLLRDEKIISFPTSTFIMVAHTLQGLAKDEKVNFEYNTQSEKNKFHVDIAKVNQEFFVGHEGQLYDLDMFRIRPLSSDSVSLLLLYDISVLKEILYAQSYLNARDSAKQFPFFAYPMRQAIPFFEVNETPSIFRKVNDDEFIDNTGKFRVSDYMSEFVFLKSGGSYSQRINILPLYLVGGSYHFHLDKETFGDSITIRRLNPEKFYSMNVVLPDIVHGYTLFTGQIDSAGCDVIFDQPAGRGGLGTKNK